MRPSSVADGAGRAPTTIGLGVADPPPGREGGGGVEEEEFVVVGNDFNGGDGDCFDGGNKNWERRR